MDIYVFCHIPTMVVVASMGCISGLSGPFDLTMVPRMVSHYDSQLEVVGTYLST